MHTILISTQHDPDVTNEQIAKDLKEVCGAGIQTRFIRVRAATTLRDCIDTFVIPSRSLNTPVILPL